MTEFFARGKMIEDQPVDPELAEQRTNLSNRDFARRAIAELIGIRHQHVLLLDRVSVLQSEIEKRILKIENPKPIVAAKKKAQRAKKAAAKDKGDSA